MRRTAKSVQNLLLVLALTAFSTGAAAQPVPSESVAPAASAAPADQRQWLKSVYEQAAASVVLIQTERGTGSGFFFHSKRHIATALHVVDDVDSIVVETSDNRRWATSVVSYSREHDVALLELEQEVASARVLVSAPGAVDVGETVAVIGHPFSGLERVLPQMRGLLNWSLTQGVVSAVSGSWLQIDAAINPGNSGGPVLNQRGEVLGVVSAKLTDAQGIGMIARVNRLKELIGLIDTLPPPRQTYAFDGVEFGFVVHAADESIEGFSLGAGLRIVKKYPVNLRFGFIGGDIEPDSPTVLATRLERFVGELTFGYAVQLGDVLELVPNLGAAVFYDRKHNAALEIDNTVACLQPPCLVEGRVLRSTDLNWRFLPMAGVTLDMGHLRVGYAYQVDLADTKNSQHRALFALTF